MYISDKTQQGKPEPEGEEAWTGANPLVFHVFGYFREENSLVLTEDDYPLIFSHYLGQAFGHGCGEV